MRLSQPYTANASLSIVVERWRKRKGKIKGGVDVGKETIVIAEGSGWKMLAKCEYGIVKRFIYRTSEDKKAPTE